MKPRSGRPVVKITDVASLAGVAPMTVSRVLNAPERVAAATAERVRAAIETLGYVPNLIAGGLSSRRSRMIAAVVPTLSSQLFADPVQSFTDMLERAGYQVMLALTGYGGHDEATMLRSILARRPDGLLLTGAVRSPAARRLLEDARVPVVEIWDTAESPTDMLVGFNHREVGAAVADHFLRHGHESMAAICASDPRATLRRQGFADRVRGGGGRVVGEHVVQAPAGIAAAREAARALLDSGETRVAVFGSSDFVGYAVVTEARLRGLSIPEQVAVCGFGDLEISRASEPPFTTVSVDGRGIGRTAAEFLLARLRGDETARRVHIPFRIVARGSE
jgi:LacI family transcriptional regulator, gluconate utilization system Gnt-I transcriptional repressor